jgi:hypothetical protein
MFLAQDKEQMHVQQGKQMGVLEQNALRLYNCVDYCFRNVVLIQ